MVLVVGEEFRRVSSIEHAIFLCGDSDWDVVEKAAELKTRLERNPDDERRRFVAILSFLECGGRFFEVLKD